MRSVRFKHECTIELDVVLDVEVTPGEKTRISWSRPEMSHPGSEPEVSINSVTCKGVDVTHLLDDNHFDDFTEPTKVSSTYANEYERILEHAEDQVSEG